MLHFEGITPLDLPWAPKALGDYEQACAACEQRVRVTTDRQLQQILGTLIYDKRKQGHHGRCLAAPLASLGLEKGMRLEPSVDCPDVGQLESLCGNLPMGGVELVFWNTAAETLTRHRNPLLGQRTQLGPQELSIDELHTMHLGAFQAYIATVFWQLLLGDAYEVGEGLAEDAKIEQGVVRLRFELFQWYRQEKDAHPDRPIYVLQDFSRHLLNPKDKGSQEAKAAENGTLFFCCCLGGREAQGQAVWRHFAFSCWAGTPGVYAHHSALSSAAFGCRSTGAD